LSIIKNERVKERDFGKIIPIKNITPRQPARKRIKRNLLINPISSFEDIVVEGKLNIICVLKSGGVFGKTYARKLKSMIARNLTSVDYNFLIFSDLGNFDPDVVQLTNNLPGWWSKLELFKLIGTPILYFDLDTLIVNNIDFLARKVSEMKENEFRMLIPFNPRRRDTGHWASGVMAWNGNFKYLLTEFRLRGNERGWDQVYIFNKLMSKGIKIKPINDFSNIVSWKRNDCEKEIPSGSEIICFHGSQKPHIMKNDFIRENWK
jgi:hypothetical protein